MMLPCFMEMDEGPKQLFCPLHHGVGLGTYHPDVEIYEFKTFVDHSLLKPDQKARVIEIWKTAAQVFQAQLEQLNHKKH